MKLSDLIGRLEDAKDMYGDRDIVVEQISYTSSGLEVEHVSARWAQINFTDEGGMVLSF